MKDLQELYYFGKAFVSLKLSEKVHKHMHTRRRTKQAKRRV